MEGRWHLMHAHVCHVCQRFIQFDATHTKDESLLNEKKYGISSKNTLSVNLLGQKLESVD